jgi:hypothetical protein
MVELLFEKQAELVGSVIRSIPIVPDAPKLVLQTDLEGSP